MSERIEDAVNATEGSVIDTLNEVLADAEKEEWQHVMVIGIRGDNTMVRTRSAGMAFCFSLSMSRWACLMDEAGALDIEHQEPDL